MGCRVPEISVVEKCNVFAMAIFFNDSCFDKGILFVMVELELFPIIRKVELHVYALLV